MSFTFILDGYRDYLTEAKYQEKCLRRTEFVNEISSGLKRLKNLRDVELIDRWGPSWGYDAASNPNRTTGTGSPLARTWKRFRTWPVDSYVRSHCFCFGLSDSDYSDLSIEYLVLTAALAKAQKRIRSFRSGAMISTCAFDTRSAVQGSSLAYDYRMHEGLEMLDLGLRFPPWESHAGHCSVQDNIRELLQSVPALKYLELYFPNWSVYIPQPRVSYKMAFPQTGRWYHLSTFFISNIAIGISDLMSLLILRMPRLRYLTLGSIDLLDGRWEGVFEVLRVAGFLHSLELYNYQGMGYHGKAAVGPMAQRQRDFIQRMQKYVIEWRQHPTLKHPGLRPEQPQEESLDFLTYVFSHCKGANIKGEADELLTRMNEYYEQFCRAQAKMNQAQEMSERIGRDNKLLELVT